MAKVKLNVFDKENFEKSLKFTDLRIGESLKVGNKEIVTVYFRNPSDLYELGVLVGTNLVKISEKQVTVEPVQSAKLKTNKNLNNGKAKK
jgi:hypothetical protein